MNSTPSIRRLASAAPSGERAAAKLPAGTAPGQAPAVAPARTGNPSEDAELSVVVLLGYN